jgi:hypothetical protein
MDCIACPSNIYNYFKHLIITFQYELEVPLVITDISQILNLTSKKIILFGSQGLTYIDNYQNFLSNNKIYLYNTEQLPSGKWDYIINSNIEEWWDYSLVNISYLQNKLFNKPMKHLPFCYSPILELPLKHLNRNSITFFGTHHPRRQDICNNFHNALYKYNILVNYNTSGNLMNESYDEFVKENMVYLNIHYYIPSILEIVRITPLLSQGHLVISERSNDEYLDRLFSPYIVWIEDLYLPDGSINVPYLLYIINNHDNNKLRETFKKLNFKNILTSNTTLT